MKTMERPEVWRFELPVSTELPGLGLPQLGLSQHPLPGSEVGNDYSMTIMDAADHRLLAWGITVGYSEDLGNWVLRAPRWTPILPRDAFFAGDVSAPPSQLTDLVQPFLRGAELVPITTRNVTQTVSALMNPVGNQLAEVIDRTIDVVLRGESALKYRELLITGVGLAAAQVTQLRDVVTTAGGVEVDQFPTLGNRLGVADFPPTPTPFTPQMSVRAFVEARLIRRWAQLAVASVPPADGVVEALVTIQRDLDGLAWAFKKSWVSSMRKLLSAAISTPSPDALIAILDEFEATISDLPVKDGDDQIDQRLIRELAEALDAMLETACTVEVTSTNPKWRQAQLAADRANNVARIAKPIFGSRARKLGRRLSNYADALSGCCTDESEHPDLSNFTVEEAFEAGRRSQQLANAAAANRAEYLANWMKLWQAVKQAEIK